MSGFKEQPNSPGQMAQSARAVLTADQLLSAIVDSSDDAILSNDLDGIVTSWNKGAERLYGYTPAEMVGKPVSIIIPPERQEEEPSILSRARRGVRVDHFETVRRRKDGSLVDVSLSVSPVRDGQGTIVGALRVARDISDRKYAERTTRLLSAIVESSNDAIASKDLNGIITSWNKAAERMFGYTAEEMIGRHVTTIFPPDRLDEEAGVIRRIQRGERIEHFETVRMRKDGSLVEVSLTVSPIRDESGKVVGASKILRDITERKNAERAGRLLSAIVESSDDAIVSKDLNGILTSWNSGAERLLGYTAAEVVGKPVTLLIPPDRADEEPGILRRVRRGERIKNLETVRRRKDGSLVDVSLTVSPIRDGEGNVVGASKILRDITELVRSRERLERTVAERTAQLRETVAELEAFSYSVAHDMRAPLRSMVGFANILQEDYAAELPRDAQAHLRRIASGAQRLDTLITDVLNYSKISRGEMQLGPVNVESLLDDILDSYEHFRASGAEVTVERPLPAIRGNTAALTQVISNLLSNAVKFVPAGRHPVVRIGADQQGDVVRLWVEDNGIGIAAKDRERIFGIFQRLNAPSEFEGTGIGLAIVRKAVYRMGGRMGLESKPGQGTCFWVELKAAS